MKSYYRRLTGTGAVLFWLLVWQLAYLAVGKSYLLVSPLDTAARLFELAGGALFWRSVFATCLRVLAGFFLAILSGAALAALAARFWFVRVVFAPVLGVIRATPVASFIILALIWMSAGRLPVFIAYIMVLPLAYSNLTSGLAAIDRQLLEMAKLFRFSRRKTARLIFIPGLMPHLTAACTAGLGFAWKSVVAAEVIAHPAFSVGRRIYDAKIYLETADLFAWTIAVIMLSVAIERGAVAGLGALGRVMMKAGRKPAPGGDCRHAN